MRKEADMLQDQMRQSFTIEKGRMTDEVSRLKFELNRLHQNFDDKDKQLQILQRKNGQGDAELKRAKEHNNLLEQQLAAVRAELDPLRQEILEKGEQEYVFFIINFILV